MKYLPDILKFVELTNQLRKVERVIYVAESGHQENDVEHSYQLAITAWYFIERFGLKLDTTKVIKYALVHDMVEAYAGDTYVYASQEHLDNKAKREHEALERLAKEFPKFPEMFDLIGAYELKKDEESRFVYALDKILPIINIYFDEGRMWHQEGISLERLLSIKNGKADIHPEVKMCFDELIELLRAEEKKLFPK